VTSAQHIYDILQLFRFRFRHLVAGRAAAAANAAVEGLCGQESSLSQR